MTLEELKDHTAKGGRIRHTNLAGVEFNMDNHGKWWMHGILGRAFSVPYEMNDADRASVSWEAAEARP